MHYSNLLFLFLILTIPAFSQSQEIKGTWTQQKCKGDTILLEKGKSFVEKPLTGKADTVIYWIFTSGDSSVVIQKQITEIVSSATVRKDSVIYNEADFSDHRKKKNTEKNEVPLLTFSSGSSQVKKKSLNEKAFCTAKAGYIRLRMKDRKERLYRIKEEGPGKLKLIFIG
jgi:hypothetical protein